MPRTITIDEAKQDLDNVLQWATENNEGVILEKSGKAAGVLMPLGAYADLVRLRKQEAEHETLKVLEKIRSEGAELNQDLTDEEIYRLAGMSEKVIREITEYDTNITLKE